MTKKKQVTRRRASKAKPPTRLHTELAAHILQLQMERGTPPGARLIELDLCEQLGVSRTPIRAALQLLESQGHAERHASRGYVLRKQVKDAPSLDLVNERDENDRHLFIAITEARLEGKLGDRCTQQELVRQFNSNTAAVIRVLNQLAEAGIVERNLGKGWTFLPTLDNDRAQQESYQLRLVLEPAFLLQPTFVLDKEWSARTRHRHEEFYKRKWRATLAIDLYEMNADFHEALARFTGNRYMLNIMQQQNRLRSALNYRWDFGADRVRAAIEEHLGILNALDKGERELASLLMRRHLEIASETPCCGVSATG